VPAYPPRRCPLQPATRWIALALASLLALPALAADDKFDQQMLDVLRQQGAITEEQYRDLSNTVAEENLPPVSSDGDWSFQWKDGFKLSSPDGATSFKFGGRIQLDGAATFASPQLTEDAFGTEFRRARIFFSGNTGKHLFFKAQYEFAGDNASTGTDFKDVYVGLKDMCCFGDLRVGHFKQAFSFNELTSSKYITFMERALPVLAFAPSRDIGISANDTAFEKRMTWSLGAYRSDTPDGEARFDNNGNYDITGRITGLPVYADDGKHLVHLGASYSHTFADEARYRTRPEQHLGGRYVDTGLLKTNGSDMAGGELVAVMGPLSFASEFISTWVDGRRNLRDMNYYGAYAEVSYFLTGENKVYDMGKGTFKRVKPAKSFSLADDGSGAWEIAGRYSHLDLGQGNGGIENDFTFGVNWYLYSNLRLMLNYVYAHVHGLPGSGTANTVEGRVSFDF